MPKVNYSKFFTKRKDGRYVATYRLDGKRHFLYDTDPERLFHRLEAAKSSTPVRFGDLADAWYDEHSALVRYKTAESYRAPLARIKDAFGDDLPEEVTAARLQAFISSLGKRGYARRTVQAHYDILSMIFDWCVLHGRVEFSPMTAVSIPHGLKTTRRKLPEDAALEAVRTRTDAPFALFALLCLYCGLRRGEALALRQEDIDRKARVIHVTKALEFRNNTPTIKQPKTSTGFRDVPIPAVLLPLLPKDPGWLFHMEDGGPITKQAYLRRWAKYCKTIGHEITAHQLRHGYATYLYEAGIPVLAAQKMLGHANASTTMNIYTHLRESKEAEAVARLDAYFSGES